MLCLSARSPGQLRSVLEHTRDIPLAPQSAWILSVQVGGLGFMFWIRLLKFIDQCILLKCDSDSQG